MSDFVVSARKYRPSNFDQVIGQSAITSTLFNAIKDNHLSQSFLFCGPRGVGKTTCARILAKTINCNNLTQEIIACDKCESCNSFNQNHSFNIHELDAASNNSVDDIRKLVDQVRFAPQVGKYNIYIIDEVHMLSSSAFNAFLKTLEEPPSHAIFILATTEKHKIIPTILSRCQIFDFKNITVSDIIEHLNYVSESEGISSEKEALRIISQKSEGSLRDALSMFDRLVNSSDLTLTYKSVVDNLNILDHDYYFLMIDHLVNKDLSSLILSLDEILRNGFDGHEFIMGLSNHLRDLLVCKDPETIILIDKGEELRERYLQQSSICELEFLIKSLRICNKCDIDYKLSKNQRLLIELTLLNLYSLNTSFAEKKNKNNTLRNVYSVNKLEEEKKTIEPKLSQEIKKDNQEEEYEKTKKEPIPSRKKPKKNSFSITEILTPKNEQGKEKLSKGKSKKINKEDMILSFKELCQQSKKIGKTNLYITLKSSETILVDNNIIQLKILNETQEKILNEHRSWLLEFLKSRLENDNIDIKIEITPDQKKMKAYTPTEKFTEMIKKNPSLKMLQDKLGLDPDY